MEITVLHPFVMEPIDVVFNQPTNHHHVTIIMQLRVGPFVIICHVDDEQMCLHPLLNISVMVMKYKEEILILQLVVDLILVPSRHVYLDVVMGVVTHVPQILLLRHVDDKTVETQQIIVIQLSHVALVLLQTLVDELVLQMFVDVHPLHHVLLLQLVYA
jgi:hypothetical protein